MVGGFNSGVATAGVTEFVRGKTTRYRCDSCGKYHLSLPQARACALRCQGHEGLVALALHSGHPDHFVAVHAPQQHPVTRSLRSLPPASHESTSHDERVMERFVGNPSPGASLQPGRTPAGRLPAGFTYEIRTVLIKQRKSYGPEEGTEHLNQSSSNTSSDAPAKIFEEITDIALPLKNSSVVAAEKTSSEEAESSVENPKEPQGPFRKPGQKTFIRKDARYECTVCKSYYFTRDEVEKCFMGHPLEPKK